MKKLPQGAAEEIRLVTAGEGRSEYMMHCIHEQTRGC